MNNRQNIWALQLVRYLITAHSYVQMSVKTNYENLNKRVDYWLVKMEGGDYSVIHITDETDMERTKNQRIALEMYEKVLNFIGKETGRVLDVSLADESSNYGLENIKYISLHPNCQLDENVEKSFPDLSKVIHDLDGDYEKNIKSLENMISLASVAKYREARKAKIKENLKKREKNTIAFKVISAICIIIFLAITITSLKLEIDTVHTSVVFGAYYKAFVTVLGDYWRLLTAGFVHSSLLHLLTNLMAFSYLSKSAERYFGTSKTLLILFASIIIGNACVFVGDKNIIAVGLSGGLYGLMGAMVVVGWQQGWFQSQTYTREFLSTVMINIFISMLPNVSLLAHLGGLVTGVFLGFVLSGSTDKVLRINFAICGAIVIGVIGYLMIRNSGFSPYYSGSDQIISEIYAKLGFKGYSSDIMKKCLEYYLSHGG